MPVLRWECQNVSMPAIRPYSILLVNLQPKHAGWSPQSVACLAAFFDAAPGLGGIYHSTYSLSLLL